MTDNDNVSHSEEFLPIKLFIKCVKKVWYWFWGHIIAFLFYKKKYYYGKHFKGRFFGLTAPGWKWVCVDFLGKRFNPNAPFPCSPYIRIGEWKTIHFHPDDLNNFQGFGNYYQSWKDGHIYIGKGTYIAPNVGIITSNHKIGNLDEHDQPKDVIIGEKCWIGMNCVIMPGVELGEHTIVGAGAIVTKSFPEGHCIIVGNPAKKLRDISE